MTLSRRTFLRGAGACVALPWLEGLLPRAQARPEGPERGKQRLAFLFVPNGKHMPEWTPKQEGREFDLPPLLEPLAPFRKDLLVLSGLALDGARSHGDGPGDHARALGSFLTCVHVKKQGVYGGV
ncbi:MAG TPA: hypothetical protein DEA08_30935, partial [Planctomycetes bacterium]|nr:hypothetical protein [Planctomycetota bacterium]